MPPPPSVRSGVGGGRSVVTAIRLAAPTPLCLDLRVWVRVGGLCRAINGPVRLFVVVLPLLLRVLRVVTGIFHFGLCFTSSAVPWRGGTGKCSPYSMQVISCSDLRSTIRVVPALYSHPFPLATVFPWRLDFGSVQVHGRLPVPGFFPVPGCLLRRFFGILLLFT